LNKSNANEIKFYLAYRQQKIDTELTMINGAKSGLKVLFFVINLVYILVCKLS